MVQDKINFNISQRGFWYWRSRCQHFFKLMNIIDSVTPAIYYQLTWVFVDDLFWLALFKMCYILYSLNWVAFLFGAQPNNKRQLELLSESGCVPVCVWEGAAGWHWAHGAEDLLTGSRGDIWPEQLSICGSASTAAVHAVQETPGFWRQKRKEEQINRLQILNSINSGPLPMSPLCLLLFESYLY